MSATFTKAQLELLDHCVREKQVDIIGFIQCHGSRIQRSGTGKDKAKLYRESKKLKELDKLKKILWEERNKEEPS